MQIGVIRETYANECRRALLPSQIEKIKKSFPVEIVIEKGLGDALAISDTEYSQKGAKIEASKEHILATSDLIIRIRPPSKEEISLMKKGSLHISYLNPFTDTSLLDAFVEKNLTAISLEMIPRTTLAQKMDVLSSQANLAGYAAVIIAASRLNKILPMMTTPAGTLTPASVFIIGAGVAGLQAIATAKRLGAKVEAFDTRPVVEEQVKSLGAKFVKIDLGETGQTKEGYAKALTEEQLLKQREEMGKICARSDIVITTAQVLGKKAPLLVTKSMIQQMRPKTVIIDMAAESGGNVEGSLPNKEVEINGVTILGLSNLPSTLALSASQMFGANIIALLEHIGKKEKNLLKIDLTDEILSKCIVSHEGKNLFTKS